MTVLQASGEADAGEVWATSTFSMRKATKSSLYGNEVRRAAIEAILDALDRLALAGGARSAGSQAPSSTLGPCLPLMTQEVRAIDWNSDGTERVLRKIRAGDGYPGVLDTIAGEHFHLFGAHPERILAGRPGELVAQRNGAICRATVDGAVWITHLKRHISATERHFKLPATHALARAGIELDLPEIEVGLDAEVPDGDTYRDIAYHEHAGVGYLRFAFYNGAMSTSQCSRLRDAYAHARAQEHTKVIVLLGGDGYFSNGIHLNEIEAADDPAEESWRNLHAIDDLIKDILETDSHLVISAIAGDAAAGGVPLALAADYVLAREDIILNPLLPAHGRPLRIGVLDLPPATARRAGHNRTAHRPAVPRDRHPRGGQDRIARRRLRHKPRGLPSTHRPPRRTDRSRRAASSTPSRQTPPPNARRARKAPPGIPTGGRLATATNASSVLTPATTTPDSDVNRSFPPAKPPISNQPASRSETGPRPPSAPTYPPVTAQPSPSTRRRSLASRPRRVPSSEPRWPASA